MVFKTARGVEVNFGYRKIDTVFVLGAGASRHLGFPTGPCLIKNIMIGLLTNGESNSLGNRLEGLGFSKKDREEFKDALEGADCDTIDEFAGFRHDLLKIILCSIAYELGKLEHQKQLTTPENNWYRMLRGPLQHWLSEKQIPPIFVTFNYERSLNAYLRNVATQRYQSLDKFWSNVKIFHVHGRLGYLDDEPATEEDFRRAYNPGLTDEQLMASAKGIRVIHQLDEDYGSDLMHAQRAVKEAKKVVFLGFGFHESNLEKLFRGDTILDSNKLFGTAYELEDNERERAQNFFNGKIELGARREMIEPFLIRMKERGVPLPL